MNVVWIFIVLFWYFVHTCSTLKDFFFLACGPLPEKSPVTLLIVGNFQGKGWLLTAAWLKINFQKIETLENRLHEAISLATGYREKNEDLEKSLKQLQESKIEFEESFKKFEEYNRVIEIEKMKVTEQLRHLNEELANVWFTIVI